MGHVVENVVGHGVGHSRDVTNLENRPAPQKCDAHGGTGPVHELLEPRDVPLGGLRSMQVRRTLPQRALPMVGAWCFLDQFGPQQVQMRVLPHPHTGLQTVTWPLRGQIRHRDSLGSDVLVRPDQLNLMTAGHGVSHSEFSVDGDPVHAVQLWVALPDDVREEPAAFEQVTDLPVWRAPGVRATVMVGAVGDARSPARVHTPLVGADVALDAGATAMLPLEQRFEHAVLVIDGAVRVDGGPLTPGPLLFLGDGRRELAVSADDGPGRFLLLGGTRFEHDLVMWWNFVGRSHADIEQARAAWSSDAFAQRFGVVAGHDGVRIPAPDLPNVRLSPRRRPGRA